MASTQQLKRRMGSIKNTKQITKAMELVSASKMRRAQENAFCTRDFSRVAREILTRLRELTDVNEHPLFKHHEAVKTRLYIVIASDSGLAGAYNSNILRQFTKELKADEAAGVISQAIVIGKQAAHFVGRIDVCEAIAVYNEFPAHPTANDIQPILQTVTEQYVDGKVDAVDIIYTDYISSVRQEVTVQRLLPAAFKAVEVDHDLELAAFEPSVKEVLDRTAERLIEAQLTQALLESFASEHSMRMMAMKNATDNASDLIDDLTLAFNTARQAGITQEIAEITGGAEAIS